MFTFVLISVLLAITAYAVVMEVSSKDSGPAHAQQVIPEGRYRFDSDRRYIPSSIVREMKGNEKFEAFVWQSISRHLCGDWGDCTGYTGKQIMDSRLKHGGDILQSRFNVRNFRIPGIHELLVTTDKDHVITSVSYR